jgi:hypothetical protein
MVIIAGPRNTPERNSVEHVMRFVLVLSFFSLSVGAAVLWHEGRPVESLDLAGGPGGVDNAPRPPFTFVKEEAGGTAPKVLVRDARGKTWSVKFGEEVKAENFASRIAWAAGYYSDPTYFVAEGTLEGARDLGRASGFVQNGRFSNARFELRDDSVRIIPGSSWDFDKSEIKDSRELAGLKVVLILVSNWDPKPENTAIVEAGGQRYYAITDWGASMGRAADFSGRSKWDCRKYAHDTNNLIEGVDNGFVVFNYEGKQSHQVLRGIKVEHVQWIMERLGKLSDAQIDAALRASGATPDEIGCFSKAFRSRLQQLGSVTHAPPEGIRSRTTRTTIIQKKVQ